MMLSVAGANTAMTLQPNDSFQKRSTSSAISSSGTQSMTRVAHSRYFDRRRSSHCYPCGQGMHNCLTSMLYLQGYKVGEIVVSHRPRIHGETKYRNPLRIFRVFWMLLYLRFWWYYTHRPQKGNTLDCSQIREIVKP